jgi:hypothetical protein
MYLVTHCFSYVSVYKEVLFWLRKDTLLYSIESKSILTSLHLCFPMHQILLNQVLPCQHQAITVEAEAGAAAIVDEMADKDEAVAATEVKAV